jgi:integrase
MLSIGVVPLALRETPGAKIEPMLTVLIQQWRNAGRLSPTDDAILGWLMSDDKIRSVRLSGLTYIWAEGWITDLKQRRFLAPSSIRQRVQALSKVLEWHLRSNPGTTAINPLRLLPRGYSVYTDTDAKVLQDKGEKNRIDVVRDRRLLPGEADRIRATIRGARPNGKERGVPLHPGMPELFEVIIYTGLRLREAYTLMREDIDLTQMVIRAKTTKQRNGKVAYRLVPIRPELYPTLKAFANPGVGPLFPDIWNGDEALLTITSNRLSARFAKVFELAPCDSLTEHDLRHEACCQWFELRDANGNWVFRPEEINKIMGWAPGSVMARRYASFRAEDLAQRLWAKMGVAIPGISTDACGPESTA